MKKLFASLILLASIAVASALPTTQLINGNLYTNATVVLYSGTNNISTNQVGVILATSTNLYNLSASIGNQGIQTSNWPSSGFGLVGYPGTLYGPSSNFGIEVQAGLTATNSTSTTLTLTWAASADGAVWNTNYLTTSYIIPVNTLVAPPVCTNLVSASIPYWALQSIVNPGANAVTNLLLEVVSKPGF